MNRLWHTDGADRKRLEKRGNIPCGLSLLEDDYRVLMARVLRMAGGVRYFNHRNQPEGYWRELFRYQPLAVLSDIVGVDVAKVERCFLEGGGRQAAVAGEMSRRMEGWLDDWELRMVYYPGLQLAKDLSSRVRFAVEEGETDAEKQREVFYGLLETLRKLQGGYEAYLKEIRSCGENDASLALLDVFLQHYALVVGRFNARWREWCLFYFREVLQGGCRGIVPDRVWLAFSRVPGAGEVVVPQGTAFVAGKNGDGSAVYYRSLEEVCVERIRLVQVRSFFPEKSRERYPAARLEYVTGVFRKVLEPKMRGEPQRLFEEEPEACPVMGLLVASPLLLLREGRRIVEVSFFLTEESRCFFRGLVMKLSERNDGKEEGIAVKLLKDAFVLGMTTGKGWEEVPEYAAVYREEGCICLTFCLPRDFPPVIPGEESDFPMLRVMMNPGAWLFPYSWMNRVSCGRIKLKVRAEGVTDLKVYGSVGELDVSVPFYPFGVQPERGAQLLFGGYELAVKCLQRLRLVCKWLQLPEESEGFYGHYREYGQEIDNASFRVRTEWLDGRTWKGGERGRQCLFASADGTVLQAAGDIPDRSCLWWEPAGSAPVYTGSEAGYEYGRVTSGFFRLVLEEPEMGFGHREYHRLFAEIMLENARRKRSLPLPALPVSPLVEMVEVDYEAEEEWGCVAGSQNGRMRLYYLDSMGFSELREVVAGASFRLAEEVGCGGSVVLGFSGAEGCDRIRFLVEVAALQQEVDMRDGDAGTGWVDWYVRERGEWKKLEPEVSVRDDTGGFISSGLVELLLPHRISRDWLDGEGVFWLCGRIGSDLVRVVVVKGFYVNVAEAVLDVSTVGKGWGWKGALKEGVIRQAARNIPGVAAVEQVSEGRGGRREEDEEGMKVRLVQRIRHRNRAVTPLDYEDLVLERFPEVAKVKCLPGLDSKGSRRKGVVTLVVVPREKGKQELPCCPHGLLLEIERYLTPLAGVFVTVDAVNPVYEEIAVRCHVGIEPGWSAGEIILRLRREIDRLIAPWRFDGGMPEFGYRFTLQELRNRIMENEGVAVLHGLSVVQVCGEGERLYRLREYGEVEERVCEVGASVAWAVPVPSVMHRICTEQEGKWRSGAGIGDLGIEENFVIGGGE